MPRTSALVSCLLLAGCGRVGFTSLDSNANDAKSDGRAIDDGRTIDLPANAVTVTFGEAPTTTFQNVTIDTYLSNEAGEAGLNYGTDDVLRSEQDVVERILLRFDLAAIATTSNVLEATLTIEITQANPAATLELHPVLQLWQENFVNFTARTLATNWANAGCGEPSSAGPTLTSAVPASVGPLTIPLPASTIAGWVAMPAQNFGMVFYNTDISSVRFASREYATISSRPLLTVTYVP